MPLHLDIVQLFLVEAKLSNKDFKVPKKSFV